MRKNLIAGAVACTLGARAAAQFGASGGPSREVELLVEMPWLFVAAFLLAAWWGPSAWRPMLRRAAARGFVAFLVIEALLFAAVLFFRAVLGPSTPPLAMVGGLFLAGLAYSGVLISVLMIAALALLRLTGMLRRSPASNSTMDVQ